MTTPTFAEMLRRAMDARLLDVHTAIPARVEAYDAATLSVDAQPLIKQAHEDENGDRVVEQLPVIPSVPVVFPGSGGYRVTFPIVVGDLVLLVFSEASIDKWLETGGLVDPIDDHRHNISDAIAIPGLRSFASPSAANTSALVIEGDDVRLGDDTGTAVALKSDLDSLKSIFNNWTPVANDGGGALKTLLGSWTPAGATKVKAK